MKMGRREPAQVILERIGGKANAQREIAQIEAALQQEEGHWSEPLHHRLPSRPDYRHPAAVFGQFSGINAIMYFAPEIFKASGSGTDAAFTQTVIVGITNVVFTFVAIWFVDKAGRKPLLIAGTLVQVLSLTFIGILFATGRSGTPLLIGILGFVAAFAVAMGPIPWIVNSEIFPTKLRGRAMSVAIFCLWFADWIVTQTFPMLREKHRPRRYLLGLRWLQPGQHHLRCDHGPRNQRRTLEEIEASWNK